MMRVSFAHDVEGMWNDMVCEPNEVDIESYVCKRQQIATTSSAPLVIMLIIIILLIAGMIAYVRGKHNLKC